MQKRKQPVRASSQNAVLNRILKNGAVEKGVDMFQRLSDAETEITKWYSTTVPVVDVILTGKVGRGFPASRLVELYGEMHCGKTTLGCLTLAEVQRNAGVAVLWDTENTFTEGRAQQLGVDANTILYASAEYVEHVFEGIDRVLSTVAATPAVIFWDTIAGTCVFAEQSRTYTESGGIAGHARALSTGFRRIGPMLSQTNVCIVACNQLKVAGIGTTFATDRVKEGTIGGSAIKFHSHIRLRVRAGKKYQGILPGMKKKVHIGEEVNAMVTKDKNGPSDVLGRGAILVLRKIGPSAGRFANGLSVLRTLQKWKALSDGDSVSFAGVKYTAAKWEEKYDTDPAFQNATHAFLEVVNARLLRTGVPQAVDTTVPEDEDDLFN